jgi:similar to stage IV sporulation protein
VGLLLKNGVPSTISPDGGLMVRERDVKKLRNALDGRVNYDASETLGIYGKILGLKNKTALAISLSIVILLCILSQNVIWDVRIDGNESISDSEIILELENCGLSVGDFWHSVDRSLVETKVLADYPKLAWININRRGSVAYVDVIEKEVEEVLPEELKCSNIVASEDCIIEEITVKCGVAVVKVGDVVKKGDLLISGVLPRELGGGFCTAQGEVKGRVADSVEVEVKRSEEKKMVKKKRLAKVTLNFFNFSINIFKIYGNLDNECDIIEEKETFSLLGNKKLPFSITKEYLSEYEIYEKVYSDDEITALAGKRLTSRLFSRLVNADLVKIKTFGEFTESGYRTYSDFIFCADVGRSLEYQIE